MQRHLHFVHCSDLKKKKKTLQFKRCSLICGLTPSQGATCALQVTSKKPKKFLLKMDFQGLRGADSSTPIWTFCGLFSAFRRCSRPQAAGAARGGCGGRRSCGPWGMLRSRGSRAGSAGCGGAAAPAAQTCPVLPGLCSGVYLAQN